MTGSTGKLQITNGGAKTGTASLRATFSSEGVTRQAYIEKRISGAAASIALGFAMRVDDASSTARIQNVLGSSSPLVQIGLYVKDLELSIAVQKGQTSRFVSAGRLELGRWEALRFDVSLKDLKATLVREDGASVTMDMTDEWSGWNKESLRLRFGASFVNVNETVALSFDDAALSTF